MKRSRGSATGRGWAYAMAGLGVAVSVAANVAHSYVPPNAPAAAPIDWAGDYTPPVGAVLWATFWPVALLGAIEMMARVAWPDAKRWKVLRWAGLVPVAAVSAVVSYRHMSGLLRWYHEDDVTVFIGPLAVDGLMVMAAGALIATSVRRVPDALSSSPARVSLVKDQMARWARYRGLPADTPLAAIVEHERTQAKLAGTSDALGQIGMKVNDLKHAVSNLAERTEVEANVVTAADLERIFTEQHDRFERLAAMLTRPAPTPPALRPVASAAPRRTVSALTKPASTDDPETVRGREAKRRRQEDAERIFRESRDAGTPLSPRDLAQKFSTSESWGRAIVAKVTAESPNGKVPVGSAEE